MNQYIASSFACLLWLMPLTLSANQLPVEGRAPVFTPDGKSVVYRLDTQSGDPELWQVELTGKSPPHSLKVEGARLVRLGGTKRLLIIGPGLFPDLFWLDPSDGQTTAIELEEPPSGLPFAVNATTFAYAIGYDSPAPLRFINWTIGKAIEAPMPLPGGTCLVSPHGKYAAVQTQTDGAPNLEIVEISSGQVVFRTHAKQGPMPIGGCHSPVFTPDERFLVYIFGDIQPVSDLILADLSTGTTTRLTTDGRGNQSPDISPDGKNLVYAAEHGGRYEVRLKRLP